MIQGQRAFPCPPGVQCMLGNVIYPHYKILEISDWVFYTFLYPHHLTKFLAYPVLLKLAQLTTPQW